MFLGLAHHALDVILRQRRAAGDRHRLLLARALVLGRHVHDAVGVDVECHLDLRYTAGRWGNALELESSEVLVVSGELALALEHLDRHGRLVVIRGGEGLAAFGGDGRVALDELGHDAALCLNTEAQGGDVDEQYVLALTLQHASLESGANGDDLIRVDALVGVFATGELLDEFDDGGHTGRSTDEHNVRDIRDLDSGLFDDVGEGLAGALKQVGGELLELGAGERLVEVGRAVLREREVWQLDRRAHGARELLLRLLGCLLEALLRDLVAGDVDTGRVLEALDQVVDDPLVPVVSTEAVVAGGGAHLDGGEVVVFAHFEQRDVEGSATEVEDQDELVFLALVETVGEGGRGGLVDDAKHVESGDFASLLRGLALGVVEVGGNGDHRIRHCFAEVLLSIALELGKDSGRDLLRGVLLAVDVDGPVGAHVALDRRDGAVDVGDVLALRGLTDEHLAILGEGNDGRRRSESLGVGDDGGFSTLED